MTAIFAVTFVMSAVLICKWTLTHYDDDDDDDNNNNTVHNRNKDVRLLESKLNYRGDWYLLRAKLTNDSNFFVREVGRGSGVLERSFVNAIDLKW